MSELPAAHYREEGGGVRSPVLGLFLLLIRIAWIGGRVQFSFYTVLEEPLLIFAIRIDGLVGAERQIVEEGDRKSVV